MMAVDWMDPLSYIVLMPVLGPLAGSATGILRLPPLRNTLHRKYTQYPMHISNRYPYPS